MNKYKVKNWIEFYVSLKGVICNLTLNLTIIEYLINKIIWLNLNIKNLGIKWNLKKIVPKYCKEKKKVEPIISLIEWGLTDWGRLLPQLFLALRGSRHCGRSWHFSCGICIPYFKNGIISLPCDK